MGMLLVMVVHSDVGALCPTLTGYLEARRARFKEKNRRGVGEGK